MAISPPSDIVMDVIRAADPAAVREASERLKSGATANTARVSAAFEATMDRASSSLNAKASDGNAETFRKFEAMVLQNFIKYMLPADGETVFGKGTAGNIWKGMMAEQMANVIAERGGIGIADRMLTGRFGDEDAPQAANADPQGSAARLVQEMQMRIFEDIGTGAKADQTSGGGAT